MLSSKRLEQTEVQALAKLPSLDALRAQLLGLLSKPAQQMVFVINAVPQNILNVLQAKADAKDDN
jgi:large subunit ribosomal protein L10